MNMPDTGGSIRRLVRGASFLLHKLVGPDAASEDDRRREFILNVILLGIVGLVAVLDISVLYDELVEGPAYRGVSFGSFTAVLAVFLGLYLLSRAGRFIAAAYIFIISMFGGVVYAAWVWGPDLPVALLSLALLIIISSILISTRFGFFMVLAAAALLLPLGYAENAGFYEPNTEWKLEPLHANDTLVFAVILLVTALISWLSNREIEASLRRARKSEAELKNERDLLEIKVEERTSELKRVQSERMAELSRFAEFGRLAAGMIHDLLNPLTAVALNVEELSKQAGEKTAETESSIASAIRATRRMEQFILAIRKQLGRRDETRVRFSPSEEIHSVLELMEYGARRAGVELLFEPLEAELTGDPVKFHQIVSSLVSNSIDALESITERKKEVRVRLFEVHGNIRLEVEDNGIGIQPEDLPRIFDPFYTTKDLRHGTGIGLSTAKHLIEKFFGGTIRAESVPGAGTKITVEFGINGERKA